MSSFFTQDNIVIYCFIAIIVALCLWFYIDFRYLRNVTRRLYEQLSKHYNEPYAIFDEPFLQDVTQAYVGNIQSGGVHKLNTESLIDHFRPHDMRRSQSMLQFYMAAVISMGLLGTFFGLFIALGGFGDVLKNNTGLDLNLLRKPLLGVNIKFISSIFGILAAIGMNFFVSRIMRPETDRCDTMLLHYLDNVVAPAHAKDTTSAVGDMLARVEERFSENIHAFTERVDAVNDNMGQAAGVLVHVMTDMRESVGTLNAGIGNLLVPLERFASRIESVREVTGVIDGQINRLEHVSEVLAERVVTALADSLNRSVDNIHQATEHMKIGLELSANKLSESIRESSEKMKMAIIDLREEMVTSKTINTQLSTMIDRLSTVNGDVARALTPFKSVMDEYQHFMGEIKQDVGNHFTRANEQLGTVVQTAVREISDMAVDRSSEVLANRLGQQLADLADTDKLLHTAIQGYDDALRKAIEANAEAASASARKLQDALSTLIVQSNDSNREYHRLSRESYDDYKAALVHYDQEMEALRVLVNDMGRVVAQLGQNPTAES